jgi:hypothetical protein
MRHELVLLEQKLMKSDGFSHEEASSAVADYKAFMVQFINSNGPFRPSVVADVAWHAHLEEDDVYTRFCSKHIGRYVHHIPDSNKLLGHCGGSAGCSGEAR